MIRCVEMAACPLSRSDRSFNERSDKDIRLALWLEQELLCQMQLPLRIHVYGEQLQLFGVVRSWYQKQHAQEIIRVLAPQYRICNELQVVSEQ